MRFMIIVKATEESEAGVMPEEDRFDAMAMYHEELQKAGVLRDRTLPRDGGRDGKVVRPA